MDYTIVELEEKILVGIGTRTKNSDPKMQETIAGLWKNFFEKGYRVSIPLQKGEHTIALYDAYESDVNGEYDLTVGVETIESGQNPEGCIVKKIPAGRYARFIVKGNMQEAIGVFWEEFWKMKSVQRSYKADFEEYLNADPENCEIHIYISI